MGNLDSRQTPPSLLLRLRDVEDAAAWQTFVDVYAPLIYRYCRRHRLQDADATDVTQEVLTQVARSIRTFEYQPEAAAAFATGSARSHAIACAASCRKRDGRCGPGRRRCGRGPRRGRRARGGHRLDGPIQRAPAAGGPGCIRPHFEETTWQTFQEVWLHDRPVAAVAEEVGIAVASVYVAKSRVLKRSAQEEILLLAEDVPVSGSAAGPDATSLPEPPAVS